MRGNFTSPRDGALNPNYKDGRKGTRLYRIYCNILSRCYNSHVRSYANYGARGIKMCPEWKESFSLFREWALENGYADHLTIDRIDVNGDYSPENCRWVTLREQCLNRRNNHYVTINGETKPLDEWSKLYGLNPKTVRSRLHLGWEVVSALTTPVGRCRK